jgi:hypothetical protein
MSIFEILNLIPPGLEQKIVDALVGFVAEQAKKLLGDQAAQKIESLKSDGAFKRAFREGLQRAADRFAHEYEAKDKDLVTAISADAALFQDRQVQQALLAIVQNPAAYLADERERVVASFENVFPECKDRRRVDRAVTVFLKCLAEELWTLPELQGVYSLLFQRTTAEAARQQVELQKAQLQATAGLRVDVRQALLQLTDAIAERERLPSPGMPASLPSSKVYHNLPNPDYGTFIGRQEELKQVHRILRPYPHSQHALVTIDGIGGIGKSALALEVAHRYLRDYDRLPPEERFEAIIWTSAKSSVLTANGIAPTLQITRTLEDIYATISITVEREDITRAPPEEQDERVTRALTQQRTLLIVDNLETVDDERVNALLRELPAPTKAIVTTRHRIDVAYPVRLTGMPKEDGLALIAQERAKKGARLTEAEAEKLYDRTGGVPLAIVWSIAQVGFGYDVEAVLRRLGQPCQDISRFVFEGSMEHIHGTDAHKLAMALSLFATDATREVLGYVAGLDRDILGRDEGLVDLERLSLLNKQGERFSLLPLTRSYLAHELTEAPEFEQAAFERMLTYYKQLATPEVRLGFPYWDGMTNYVRDESLEPESGNLVHTIHLALDRDYNADALDLFLSIVHSLNTWGLWDQRLELAHKLCQVAHQSQDPVEVWLWVDAIGYISYQRQQFSEGIQALNTGRTLARQYGLVDALLLADAFEARLYLGEGDAALATEKTESLLKQLDLDSIQNCGTLRRIISRRIVSTAALVYRSTGAAARAKELHECALALRRSTDENPIPDLSNLAHVSIQLDDLKSAKGYLAQVPVGAGKKDAAWNNYELARIAEREGEIQKAIRLCELALKQFTQLRSKSGVRRCQQLLARLLPTQAQGDE